MNLAQMIDFERLEADQVRTALAVQTRKSSAPPDAMACPSPRSPRYNVRRPRNEWRHEGLLVLAAAKQGVSAPEFAARMNAPSKRTNVLLHGLLSLGWAKRTGQCKHYLYFVTAAGRAQC